MRETAWQKYYRKNRERVLERNKKYRAEHWEEYIVRHRDYRRSNPDIGRRAKDMAHFSGNKSKSMDRDGHRCVLCGISNDEHLQKHKRSLHTHHKDFNGRNSKNPNNNLDNLETLCIDCHASKHEEERLCQREVSQSE